MVSVAAISITTVIFGIGALILSSRARNRLSPGSLRRYIDNFSVCLAFMVVFSLWMAVRSIANIEVSLSGFTGYPELIFIVFAFIGFIIASYRVSKISEEFGFKEEGREMRRIIEKRRYAMDRRKKEAQVSVEYMFLIGFATVITIPLIIIYQSFIQESGVEITSSQISQVAKNIVDAAESVYYLGEPSQTALKANIPDNVASADLSAGYEVVFRIRDKSGIADIVRNSAVNITGSLPVNKGTYTITVKAVSGHVEVSYK